MADDKRRKKVLAVASLGGHWVQLLRLTAEFEPRYDMVYVSTNPGADSMLAADGAPFYCIKDFSRTTPWRIFSVFRNLFSIIRRERPDVVLTTGAAPGLVAVIAARLTGRRAIWVDSIANASTLSASGKVASLLTPYAFTQWSYLAGKRVKYAGAIFSNI